MTEQELEEIAVRVTRRVLHDLGINTENPFEVRRDFEFVREWRRTTESVRDKSILTIVGILVAGSLAMVWLGVRHLFGGGAG